MNKSIKDIIRRAVAAVSAVMLCGLSIMVSGEKTETDENSRGVSALDGHIVFGAEQQATSRGFVPVLEKDGLTLLYKDSSAEIALYSKANDEVVYSNPQDISEDTGGTRLHRMTSQLYITYYEDNTKVKYYSSRFDSLEKNQVTAQLNGDTLSVNYIFGRKKITKEMLPAAIPADKFEKKVISKLSEEEAKEIKKQYSLISKNDFLSKDDKAAYRDKYKNYDSTDLYILNVYIPEYEVESIYNLLYKGDYTESDLKEDNKASGNEVKIVDTNVIFNLTLNYSLEESALKVELDCSNLTTLDTAAISSVNVLEFFGCATDSDKGYCLIPDGSGGLISFNSTKSGAAPFKSAVYGADRAVRYNLLNNNGINVMLPVIGISRNESGILAVAGEGAEYCSINADIADDVIPYNIGYFSAEINPHDEMSVANQIYGGGKKKVYVHQKEPYKGIVSVKYYMLEKGKNTYSDMAVFYRGLLEREGILKNKLSGSVPFVYELVGGIDVKKHFLGIPYTGIKSLTTFEQAEQIINELKKDGIEEQKVKYNGWFNGGIRQTSPIKVNVLSCLGGKKQLDKLISSGKADIYPNVSFTEVSGGWFDGFSPRQDAARLTYNEIALIYGISIAKDYFDFSGSYKYLASPAAYRKTVGNFLKKYNYDKVSLEDLTSCLNSDFSKKSYTDRSAALKLTNEAIADIAEKCNIMASAPNLYSATAVSVMTNIPTETSGANIIDKAVPFLQIVYSGYKDMTTAPINTSYGDFRFSHLLSFGVAPNYMFGYEKSSEIVGTEYSELYSLCFEDWREDAVQLFGEYSKVMNKLRGSSVISHKISDNGVCEIIYDNGCTLVVNDTSSLTVYGGDQLAAGAYILKEAK